MAHLKHRFHHRSPPPRKIPSLPHAIRFQPSRQTNEKSNSQARILLPENHISHEQQYHPATDSMIVLTGSEQSSFAVNPSLNQIQASDQPLVSSERDPAVENNNNNNNENTNVIYRTNK